MIDLVALDLILVLDLKLELELELELVLDFLSDLILDWKIESFGLSLVSAIVCNVRLIINESFVNWYFKYVFFSMDSGFGCISSHVSALVVFCFVI